MDEAFTPLAEPIVDPYYQILWESDEAAVIDKSGNLPCYPSGRYRRNTLLSLLQEREGWENAYFVSRLDRETSGCVLVAKTVEAASKLGKAMMRQAFHKEYLCIVRGVWGEVQGAESDAWLDAFGKIIPVHDEVVHKSRAFVREYDWAQWQAEQTAQSALTRIRPLAWETVGLDSQALQGYLLLQCEPKTGRTHQIRATLRGLGFEVVGDKLYGPDRTIYARMCEDHISEEDRKKLILPRQALHAWRLSFTLPDGEGGAREISVEADPGPLCNDFFTRLHSSES